MVTYPYAGANRIRFKGSVFAENVSGHRTL